MSFLERTKETVLFFGAKKRTKRSIHPLQGLPLYGEDATAPTRRSFIKVCSDHQRSGINCPNGGCSPPYPLAVGDKQTNYLCFKGCSLKKNILGQAKRQSRYRTPSQDVFLWATPLAVVAIGYNN